MSKYYKNLTKEQIELMEILADIEHQRWADWQKYMHSKMKQTFNSGVAGSVILPRILFDNWERQIKTDYKDLSEKEKDSDREQVMRYWNLINPKKNILKEI